MRADDQRSIGILASNPSEQEQDEHDQQNETKPSARRVTPIGAVGPARQGADQEADQDNDQYRAEHGGVTVV